ncbi:glycosyl transferase family 1 [Actinobacillus succinogenes]|uniref:Glycosyl transferase group 1 n=1 Tax=Actinobacillus succinogenes (strain ATCC 55618 / DSM 22257 / CCUG 43843 / 130Z) TaxID=339671 RepID=A6VKE2_ACTSZ|nr:glycosyltransferase family 4 protein [Actinobacillus succinogenes]ABR73439.1 glycosyl transferase group 1 [Actinobacillus succinogenes 130Z]PHI40098.1 glycosyl transferase family 1 [Actinobacillus succinogenes]
MRVAYICADPGIPVFGTKGASVHVQEVIKGMLAKGLDVTLFAQRLGGDVPQALKNIKIRTLNKLPEASAEIRARAALDANTGIERLLASEGPFDVVYERYSLWSNAGMNFAKKHRCIGILEVNAPLIEEQKKHRTLPLEAEAQDIAQSVFSDADAMIAVSPGVRQYLESFAKAKGRVHVIANGVNLERFASAALENQKRLRNLTALSEITIGFLGTLKPWHGLATLVDAWKILRRRNQHIRLLIVGDGPEYAYLYSDIKNAGLTDYVTFTGTVQPEQVPYWLAQMDIAVAPYPQLDNFYFSPLKIYEYMASGIPVITTRVGHLEKVVCHGQNGMLVEAENPEQMADCIERLVAEPLRLQQLGIAARQTAEREHSWLSVVERIIRIAESINGQK